MLKLFFEDDIYPKSEITHIRKTARGFVINEENKIAFIHVVCDDIFGHRDLYETPGGGVKENETIEEAVIREVEEEIGLQTEIVCPLAEVIDFYNLIHRQNENHYFLLKIKGKANIHLEDYEKEVMKEIIWASLEEAIYLYQNKQIGGVGKLVQRRELPILLEIQRMGLLS